MGRGGYHGGGTVIGYGMAWSDSGDFPARERQHDSPFPSELKERQRRAASIRAAKKAAKKRKAATSPAKLAKGARASKALQPPFPPERVPLIASVMRDIGQPLPKKAMQRNRVLHRLLAKGIVLPDGKLNTKHASLQFWLRLMEKTKSD